MLSDLGELLRVRTDVICHFSNHMVPFDAGLASIDHPTLHSTFGIGSGVGHLKLIIHA